jgi:hypothetical protein
MDDGQHQVVDAPLNGQESFVRMDYGQHQGDDVPLPTGIRTPGLI